MKGKRTESKSRRNLARKCTDTKAKADIAAKDIFMYPRVAPVEAPVCVTFYSNQSSLGVSSLVEIKLSSSQQHHSLCECVHDSVF